MLLLTTGTQIVFNIDNCNVEVLLRLGLSFPAMYIIDSGQYYDWIIVVKAVQLSFINHRIWIIDGILPKIIGILWR